MSINTERRALHVGWPGRMRAVGLAACGAWLATSLSACAIVGQAPARGAYDRETGTYTGASGSGSENQPGVKRDFSETGEISYYAAKFEGRRTASGEAYSGQDLTAAHRELPFGTRVKVTHLGNGKSVTVRVNDRGPFTKGRIMDVSLAAARQLGLTQSGTAKARIEVALD